MDGKKRLTCWSQTGIGTKRDKTSPDGYALYPLFSTIELLIPLGAEFNALSPHKLWESVGDSIWR